jgi:tetratricopeptide (TPR) repeat protein
MTPALPALVLAVTGVLAPAQAAVDDGRARQEALLRLAAGERALTAERYGEAAEELEQAAKLDPLLVLAHCGLGQARMALDQLERQLDWLRTRRQRASGVDSRTPAWISFALAGAYFRNGAFTDAEREYRASLEVSPSLGEAHYDLAMVYLATKRPDAAEREVALAEKAGVAVPDRTKAEIGRLRSPPARRRDDAASPQAVFAELARRYAAGDRGAAIGELLRWPDASIGKAARPANGVDLPVRPALMLLTDAAARRRADARSGKAEEQLAREIAHRALEGPRTTPALGDFVRRWYEAVALRAQSEARWDDALDWAERGRKAFPGSADLTQVVASIEELAASLPAEPAADDLLGETGNRYLRRQVAQAAQARQHLEHARRLLLVAAAAAPARVDLRLRLGRIAWRLGDLGSARSELQAALAGARSGSDACLANLFLGRVLEDEGRLTEAAGSYEAAVALAGQSQAARLALSYLRLRQGDETAALLELEAAIRPAGQRRTADPFWRYAWGFADRAEGLLEALRREASS